MAAFLALPCPVANPRHAIQAPDPNGADPRRERLEEFFGKRDCPALVVVGAFLHAADAYGLDWRLLPSISFVESTGGKAAKNNNLFGWDNGQAEFTSLSAAVYAVGYSLAHSRLYKNKDLDEILETYNPDAEYARKVKSVMYRISPAQ